MQKIFKPIENKSGEIIDYLMSYPLMPGTKEEQYTIRLCIEEAVVNITEYAYKKGEEGWLEACIDYIGNTLIVKLVDSGIQFNPLEKEDPDITLSAEDREVGGLGIFLCKSLMDDVKYNYINGCNTLTMLKDF